MTTLDTTINWEEMIGYDDWTAPDCDFTGVSDYEVWIKRAANCILGTMCYVTALILRDPQAGRREKFVLSYKDYREELEFERRERRMRGR